MDDRNEYRSRQQGADYGPSQPEQWDDRSYREGGQEYDDRTAWRGNKSRGMRDFSNSSMRDPRSDRGLDRMTEDDRARSLSGQRRYDGRATYSHRHDPAMDRGYGRFTSESYGGRDFSDPGRAPYYGYASGVVGTGLGASYPSPYDYGDTRHGYDRDHFGNRPFLERAGDEIASWFGDNDAARRREMDHRGNGPQGYQRSDERILEDVCDRLTEDRFVDARDITVTVQDGEVTLNGTVSAKGAKRRAEDCADDATGVSHVQNNLRIQQASQGS